MELKDLNQMHEKVHYCVWIRASAVIKRCNILVREQRSIPPQGYRDNRINAKFYMGDHAYTTKRGSRFTYTLAERP